MQSPIPQSAAIILCGGQSRRMGAEKASLAFGAETLLSRIARIVSPVVTETIIVAAPQQTLPKFSVDVRVVYDETPGLGPLEGVRCGLDSVGPGVDRALVCGCDTPLITTEAVRILFEKLDDLCDAAVTADIERMHPTFGVYRVHAAGVAARQLLAGERSLHGFVRHLSITAVSPAELGGDQLLHNVNTPEEYASALLAAGLPPAEFPPPSAP
ncbi:molybdenum cofactor guanylyltransferase [Blastopirellula sp. JC732]|uniref:Probable molybdenum cofactor guanylyltransferase n=1 Tax=Blastopirellula sediminis TaxID=2894196 RepID=A0A9X1MQ29_9BACT|nr:molybdenum cofactor guanylyltransferase [Blastopirellula sediminis]MCC9606017.1 molybdenum cofactor guanylyltransferase [Blastopirellula sediminis]MCC9630684.1 molybdenum cofactor guanylyltransferase [Blastopirellula sediminis]